MNVIIDFDSTLVCREGLDLLAEISISSSPSKIAEIKHLTILGMAGELYIEEALTARLNLLEAKREDLDKLIKRLFENLSPSAKALFSSFSPENLYVVSSGFIEYVLPICTHLGFLKKNIFANQFVYDDDRIIGFDNSLLIAQHKGKSKVINQLDLKRPLYMVGDGYTDLETKLDGAVDIFIAYTETIHRGTIVSKADSVCSDFYEVVEFILANE